MPRTPDLALIPQPQSVEFLEGAFPLGGRRLTARGPRPRGRGEERFWQTLRACVPRLTVRYTNRPAISITTSGRGQGPVPDGPSLARAESYLLDVTAAGVRLRSESREGLFRGMQTLLQVLAERPRALPAVRVYDYPAVPLRGVHLDLKGNFPRYEWLCDLVAELASYKINWVVIEYEDKFRYRRHPQVAAPQALGPERWAAFHRLCREHYIEATPLVQCLAHVDYVLRVPRYRDLREHTSVFQYCPLNPRVIPLWAEFAEEVAAVHRGGRYFHIGADEGFNLGECPRCRRRKKEDLFLDHVGQAVAVTERMGLRPILWDDMLRGVAPRKWAPLEGRVDLMVWQYGYGGRRGLPALARFVNRGWPVFGASAFKGAGGWNIGRADERMANIREWTEAAERFDLKGVLATGWTRVATSDPPCDTVESARVPLVFAAASPWTGGTETEERFTPRFLRRYLGVSEPSDIVGALELAASDPREAARRLAAARVTRHRDALTVWRCLARLMAYERDAEAAFSRVGGYVPMMDADRMAGYRIDLLRRIVAGLEKTNRSLEREMRRVFAPSMDPADLDELIASRLLSHRQWFDAVRRRLDALAPV